MRGTVAAPVADPPAFIFRIVLGTRKSPHVVQRPDHWLADPADVLDRKHLAINPVHVDDIGIAGIQASWPAGRQYGWGMDDRIVGPQGTAEKASHPSAHDVHRLSACGFRAGYRPITRDRLVDVHSRIDLGTLEGMVDAIGSAGGAAACVGMIQDNGLQVSRPFIFRKIRRTVV